LPTVHANGVDIYYEIHGRGEPLLVIGGLGIDLTQLSRMDDELAEKHQVIAIDNRGTGRSDKPDVPYSIGMMSEDAAGLLGAIRVQKTSVLGVSLGGRIALSLAISHPELVKSLILVSTSARTDYRRGILWWLSNQLLRIPAVRRIGTKYPQPYYAYVRQRDASRGYDATSQLGEIRIPTLIIHGRADRMVPYRMAEELHSGINGSRLVAFDGGHLMAFRQTKKLVPTIEDFLETTVS
jgi:3-oxoadipate enol-lactonase